MQITANGTPRAQHRVNPKDVRPHLAVIRDVADRLFAGRADREAWELNDAATAIEACIVQAWGRR